MTPTEQEARSLRSKHEEAAIVRAYKEVFGSPSGQLVFAHMAKACGLEAPVFDLVQKGGHYGYDPINAALNDGGRMVIMKIKKILNTPDEEEKPKPTVKKAP